MAVEWVVSKNGKRFEYDNDYASVVVYDVENGCGCYGIHTIDGLRIENDIPTTFLSLLEDFQTYVREVMVKKIQMQEDKDYELFKQLKARFEPSGEENESGTS